MCRKSPIFLDILPRGHPEPSPSISFFHLFNRLPLSSQREMGPANPHVCALFPTLPGICRYLCPFSVLWQQQTDISSDHGVAKAASRYASPAQRE